MAIAGNDIRIANNSQATNTIDFNPVISALTGTGGLNPSVTAPQTSNPSGTASSAGNGTDSLMGGLGAGGGIMPGVLQPGTALPYAGLYGNGLTGVAPNGVALQTNSQTMMWLLLAGGMALVMLMGGGGKHK